MGKGKKSFPPLHIDPWLSHKDLSLVKHNFFSKNCTLKSIRFACRMKEIYSLFRDFRLLQKSVPQKNIIEKKEETKIISNTSIFSSNQQQIYLNNIRKLHQSYCILSERIQQLKCALDTIHLYTFFNYKVAKGRMRVKRFVSSTVTGALKHGCYGCFSTLNFEKLAISTRNFWKFQ